MLIHKFKKLPYKLPSLHCVELPIDILNCIDGHEIWYWYTPDFVGSKLKSSNAALNYLKYHIFVRRGLFFDLISGFTPDFIIEYQFNGIPLQPFIENHLNQTGIYTQTELDKLKIILNNSLIQQGYGHSSF